VQFYRDEDGTQLAAAFIEAVEQAVRHIGSWPSSGSTRFAELLSLPGLRSFALHRFPHILFYFEQSEQVDVWRVLHSGRDIHALLVDDAMPSEGST